MLNNDQITQLHKDGFLRIPNYLDSEQITAMMTTMTEFRDEYYSEDNLRQRKVYLSDSSPTRVSNAYMVSTGDSGLPHISVSHQDVAGGIINDYQIMMDQLLGGDGAIDTRLMLNMQEYKEASKPVPWHFDGEYLDCNTTGNSGTLEIVEALVPNYVAVYTLYNDNDTGTSIKNIITGEESVVESRAGDFFIFDNTSHLHSVESLAKDRAMFGFRNFDYRPALYSQTYTAGAFPTTNDCFSGYAGRVTTRRSQTLQENFIEQWKQNYTSSMKAKF